MDDFDQILENGIVFKGASKGGPKDDGKVKTKAKKKKYITGAHGSGSARQKAKYRDTRRYNGAGKPVDGFIGFVVCFLPMARGCQNGISRTEALCWLIFQSVLRRIRLRIQKSGTPEGNSAMIISCLKED